MRRHQVLFRQGVANHAPGHKGFGLLIYERGAFRELLDPLTDVAAMKRNSRREHEIVATRLKSWLNVLRNGYGLLAP